MPLSIPSPFKASCGRHGSGVNTAAMEATETKTSCATDHEASVLEPCYCCECVRKGLVSEKSARIMRDLQRDDPLVHTGAGPVQEVLAAVHARRCRRRDYRITPQHAEEVRIQSLLFGTLEWPSEGFVLLALWEG